MDEFETNTFWYMARKYVSEMREKDEILRENITELFTKELDMIITRGELIKININGQVRKGKSTTAIALGKHIFKRLQHFKKRERQDEFTIKNIARDQQEYSKLMRDPELYQTVIVVDENSEMEKTGENSTAESALALDFSNIHASRYVHTIYCSPQEVADKNADILLEMVSTNKITKNIMAYVYYKYIDGGYMQVTPVGYIVWNVGELVKNWASIEEIYHKAKKTKEEEEHIKKIRESDFYTDYMCRKLENMYYITQEGIMRKKSLDYAEIAIEVIETLKPMAEARMNITLATIKNFVKKSAEERKIPMSIIGDTLEAQAIQGVLEQYKNKAEIESKLFKVRTKINEGGENEIYRREIIRLENLEAVFKRTIAEQMKNFYRHKEINDRYRNT